MMFERDLGGVLHLLRRTAHDGGTSRRRHRGGRTDLPLAADFGARDRGVVFEDATDCGSREQEVAHALGVEILVEPSEIAQGGRNHTGSTIGGRSDDPSAGGILFIDSHGEDREPVIGLQRIDAVGLPVVFEFFVHQPCTPLDLQPARQDSLAAQPALDTGIHRIPHTIKFRIEFFLAAMRNLVRPLHLGDRQAGFFGHLQHLRRIGEGIWHRLEFRHALFRAIGLELRIGHYEAAADRIIDALEKKSAIAIMGRERHPVGVAWQRLLPVEDEIGRRIEIIGRVSGRRDFPRPLHLADDRIHFVRIDRFRALARKPQDHRPVGRVSDSGKGQRTVQARLDRSHASALGPWPVIAGELVEKPLGRHHRSHRVGTRRPDADLEDVKDG